MGLKLTFKEYSVVFGPLGLRTISGELWGPFSAGSIYSSEKFGPITTVALPALLPLQQHGLITAHPFKALSLEEL